MANAMRSEKQTRPIVNTDCPLVVAFCNGEVLEPLPGARFRLVCRIEELDKFANGDSIVVSVEEAARRIDYKRKTLYDWIESDTPTLTEKHGLRRVGKRWKIDWTIFKACFDRGELGPCS